MGLNRYAIIRYLAYDRLLRDHSLLSTKWDLISAASDALVDFHRSGSKEKIEESYLVSERQLGLDIAFMKSEQGYNAPIECYRHKNGKYYYRYADKHFSIEKTELSIFEAEAIQQALVVMSRFQNLQQFSWLEPTLTAMRDRFQLGKGDEKCVIGLDCNELYTGAKHISELYRHILDKDVLEIKYQKFNIDEEYTWTIHPYYIKQHQNRWFLFGWCDEDKRINNVPLDRIVSIEVKKDEEYRPNRNIDFNHFFDNIIGVYFPKDAEITRVRLRFDETTFPYVLTKPIHNTQKVESMEEREVSLIVRLNPELESMLLGFGEGVEVLEPMELRERMRERVKKMWERWKGEQ